MLRSNGGMRRDVGAYQISGRERTHSIALSESFWPSDLAGIQALAPHALLPGGLASAFGAPNSGPSLCSFAEKPLITVTSRIEMPQTVT